MEIPRKHELIPSQAMGRRMHLWRYGWFGQPVIVFPSAAGFAHEWDAHGMVDTLAPLLAAGKIKLYCSESNVSQAWTRKEEHPTDRVKKHQAFERYVLSELVPFIRKDCQTDDLPMATSGCSLGGFYAANFALKYPQTFRWALCMSGRYDVTHFTDGFSNLDIYFNNPLAYVPRLSGEQLDTIRKNTHLVLVCGQGAWEEGCIEETIALADVLAAQEIPHRRDIWGREVSHNWEWWKRQATMHLKHAFGH